MPNIENSQDEPSILHRAGLRDRRIPDLKEVPHHLLDTGLDYPETVQGKPDARPRKITPMVIAVIALLFWITTILNAVVKG